MPVTPVAVGGPAAVTAPPPRERRSFALSIVVPVLNEEPNIDALHERVSRAVDGLGAELELIFVDDGSTDGTARAVRELRARDPRVKLLSFSRNFGHQFALTAGLDHASGDAVIVMDGDLEHPPELIQELVARWREGYDVVYTVRDPSSRLPLLKRWTSACYYALFRVVAGQRLPQNAADFRLLDRSVVLSFRDIRERTRFLRGLTVWVGYRSIGVRYGQGLRRAGRTKYNLRRMLGLALDGALAFSTAPVYVGLVAGILMAVVGGALGVSALVSRLEGVSRPTLLSTGVLLFVGGVQLSFLGIVGLYVAKVFDEVRHRPLYVVREKDGFDDDASR